MEAIVAVVQSFIERSQHIWRRNQIVDEVKKDHDLVVSKALVSKVLRGRFGMSYKRVILVAFQGNSERCMVMR